jgi:hypothetical protein
MGLRMSSLLLEKLGVVQMQEYLRILKLTALWFYLSIINKAGGTSLGRLLRVKRRSQRYRVEVLSEKEWVRNTAIVVVRHPFERFPSCYCT